MSTIPAGHAAVIDRRLEGLRQSILARDWTEVEFAYDQVSRAWSKLLRDTNEGEPCTS